MQFQSPVNLWGLLLVLIPILIHLFSFRQYKKVVISDLSLLRDIRNSGIARKKIKELMVLMTRVLAIVLLVLAFSDPTSDSTEDASSNNSLVKIHLDNSFSMSSLRDDVELLQAAKIIAESIIDSYEINDRFQIQSNDFAFSQEQTWQKKEAKNKLSEIQLSSSVRSFEAVVTRMNDVQAEHNFKVENYLISDFDYFLDTSFLKSKGVKLNCIAVRGKGVSNVYIDSVWFSNTERKINGFDTLQFSITNSGSSELNDFVVNMKINGNTQFTLLDIPAQSTATGVFIYKVPEGSKIKGVVSLEDNEMSFDNVLFFSYNIPEKVKVLVVSNSSDFSEVISNLYRGEVNVAFDVVSDKNIDYKMIDEYDLFVLGELKSISLSIKAWLGEVYRLEGKQIVIIPSDDIDVATYNAFGSDVSEFEFSSVDSVSIELIPVNQKSVFFNNVFKSANVQSNLKVKMPVLKRHYKILKSKGEPVLLKTNQNSFLTKSKNITLFSSGVTSKSSDFSEHPLIVPVFHKITFSAIFSDKLYSIYGDEGTFLAKPNWGHLYDIRSPDSVIFNGRILDDVNSLTRLDENFSEAGIYDIIYIDSLVDHLAVNYSRTESSDELSMYEQLKVLSADNSSITLIEDMSRNKIEEQINGESYWKLFLALAGVFLLLEMVVLKVVFPPKL
jgi:hypothetical protein